MDRLINSNTTTFYTVMSKNAGPDKLSEEIAAIPQALKAAKKQGGDNAVILARLVRGVSCESWQDASKTYELEQWHAFPVSSEAAKTENFEDALSSQCQSLPISPFREVNGALTGSMFIRLLKRELLRISRNGGCLSLVSAGMADRGSLEAALGKNAVIRLEEIMGSILLSRMEACDTLGMLRNGQYICSLPGLGQLAARNFAEKAQREFAEAARPFFPAGGISAGENMDCALGIVNILQGESGEAKDLLKRAKTALEVAISKTGVHIHQETSVAPLENTTLVQSSEKRFLFFGGDPS